MPNLRTTATVAVNMVRNSPVATVVALRRLRSDPAATAVKLIEALPEGLLKPFASRPDLALVQGASIEEATSQKKTSARIARRLIAIAIAQNNTDLATDLLRDLPASDSHKQQLTARLQWKQGELEKAIATLKGSAHRSDAGLLSTYEADLGALTPHNWRKSPAEELVRIPGRVLHLVTNSLPHAHAGYTTRTHQILRAQKDVGLDPHALTRWGFPVAQGVLGAQHLDIVDGISYHRLLPLKPVALRPSIEQEIDAAAQVVAQLRPAVLHPASNHRNGQVALALRERFGLPVVYEVRGFLEESWLSRRVDTDGTSGRETDRYRLERALETSVMASADLVTTLGTVMRDEIISRGIAPEKIVVAPNAVDARFLEAQTSAVELRYELGIADKEITIGVISTLYAHEGIPTLIDAVRILLDQGAPVRLLIVGDGPERESIARQIKAVGLEEISLLTGRVPFNDIHRYYSAIDVFCVPRIKARVSDLVTPLKPIEAMATARAVVASNVGGLAEVISYGENGVLVTPDDAVALADAIAPLLYDPELRSRLGNAARSWVLEHRTWDQVARLYRDAYEQLGVPLGRSS